MRTYQDLLALGNDEQRRMDFCTAVIAEHTSTDKYKFAQEAQKYYYGENPTINRYEKILYDLQGKAQADMYTANHKIASSFFGFAVDQKVSYLLGNGVTFSKDDTADKLGKDFDVVMQELATNAKIDGVSFGVWNYDRLVALSYREFAPLYDENNGALMAGVRWWQVAPGMPLRVELYEMDGVTGYIRRPTEKIQVYMPKRKYVQIRRESKVDGVSYYDGWNYPGFPIIPLRNNRDEKSELVGKRSTIDALDINTSQMVNNTSEGALIYWVLNNYGGMDDLDDAKFLDRLRTTHIAHLNDDESTIEPHTIEAPVEGNKVTNDELKARLYEDFRVFDYQSVISGSQTATAIMASYTPLDLDVDKFEAQVTSFILALLRLLGVDDRPSYTRNRIINRLEETQTILMGAQYYDDEYITKKLLTINGDADQLAALMERKTMEDSERIEVEDEDTA